ncbi:phage tail spike protein [Streptococcus hillyeri]|uniref:Uncharacterized protein n=1 Tax=Streptococcus hillyeri TaxID=2282420 RepID=A0A3L9DWB1_9STRE|nr:phage tail spike protein [Streptococcus hillyeri]RLY03070.1 hypothetical protein EAF07_05890 [Streptococcus hillyeri]
MIYLFDKDEKLFKIVNKPAIKTALQKYTLTSERYVSDRLTVEMKALNADELEKVEYMAIQTIEDAHTFHYFYVAQKTSDNLTSLIGVQSGIEELRKTVVYDKRPQNAFAREVINDLLKDTNWQVRFIGETTPHSTNFYYVSTFDALKKVCEVWDLEMQFFVEMNGNQIGARYIDFKKKIGQAIGKRVVYGHNALQIIQEIERTNIFTALVGRGKGVQVSSAGDIAERSSSENKTTQAMQQSDGYGRKITFEDVVWSTAKGKPVNKPKGQKYLELPAMTKLYGIKNADGSMRPKIGFVEFPEEEDPEILAERTYKTLIDTARPQLTLKTSSVYLRGVKVGDTIRVVRHDKKLDYDTRIFEITFNRLNNQSSDIKLGDRVGESNEAKAQIIADKAIDNFVANEFSNFVQNLPDFLPSADGFNNNWYGAEDPSKKYPGKVIINDIWYKPDSEHEGHKIMLRWTGEVWEEILRTYDSEALRDRIAKEIAQVTAQIEASSAEHDRQVSDIRAQATDAKTLAQQAQQIGTQAKSDAANALTKALQYKSEAIAEAQRLDIAERQATEGKLATAKSQAVAEANRLIELTKSLLAGQIDGVSTELTQTKENIKLLATRATVDTLTGRVSSAESTLQVQAGEIASRVKTSDFDQAKQRLTTAESSITQLGNRITTEISETKGLIPKEFGGVNLLLNSSFEQTATTTAFVVGGQAYDKSAKNWNTYNGGISNPATSYHAYVGDGAERQSVGVFNESNGQRNWKGFSQNITSRIPQTTDNFMFSVDVFATGAGTKIFGGLYYYDKSGTRKFHAGQFNLIVDSFNKWQRVNVKVPFDKFTCDFGKSVLFYVYGYNFTTNSILYIDKLKLEIGEIATAHSVAPEELQDKLINAKTLITQTAQGQEQLSTRLSQTEGKVTTAETSIRQLINDVSSKVSQRDFDTATGRLTNAETLIAQHTGQIALKAEKTLVDNVKSTASDALAKAQANAQSITQAKAELKVATDKIASLVTKTDFNTATGRLSTLETSVEQHADEISKRLTSTQVEQAISGKGYQTKAQVDSNITGRGYITSSALQPYVTSTVLENKVTETAGSFERSITETKALIPTSTSVNLVDGTKDFSGSHFWIDGNWRLDGRTVAGADVLTWQSGNKASPTLTWQVEAGKEYIFSAYVAKETTGTVYFYLYNFGGDDITSTTRRNHHIDDVGTDFKRFTLHFVPTRSGKIRARFAILASDVGGFSVAGYQLLEGRLEQPWSPSVKELSVVTAFNTVKDTVDAHKRVIGDGSAISQAIQSASKFERSIVAGGDIYQAIETAKGLVSRVSSLSDGQNLVYDPTNFSKYKARTSNSTLALTGTSSYKLLRITQTGLSSPKWKGFQVPLHTQSFTAGEKLSYRVNLWVDVLPDDIVGIEIKNGTDKIAVFPIRLTQTGSSQIFTGTVTVSKTTTTTDDYGLHVWIRKNGTVAIGQISIVRGDVPPTSFVDSTSAMQLAAETQMSQLAGSWAVKNLTSAGTVLNQLNLNKDGSVKIDGKLVQITGTTYIQDGVITSAKIASLDAAKITAGTLDASRVNVINLNASKIVGLDANFIKAKIETAMIDWMKGKVITAKNEAMQINLNEANITFKANASIAFNSVYNTIHRTRGANTGFLKIEDSTGGGVNVIVGATSGNASQTIDTARFAGIVANRDNDMSDYVEIYGDYIYFKHAKNSKKMVFQAAAMTRDYNLLGILDKLIHNMNKLHRAGAFGRETHFTDDVSGVGFFD